jgi:hypothetical protein
MNCRIERTNETLEDLIHDDDYLRQVRDEAASLINLDEYTNSITPLEVIGLMNIIQ